MSTPIDFSTYVMNNLKIENLTQEHLVGPAFNLLKGICKSRVELEYHFKESYKAVTNRLDWTNLEGHEYPFDLSKPLLLIKDQVQKKLVNLERDVIYDLNVALRMFTRCVVILKWVEDLQLGVESYQKKLNITKPETFRSDITNMTSYTAYNNPQGIIYLDKFKRNRMMCSDELYKFCDGTLTSVQRLLHDIVSSLRMDDLPKRR
ncbi:hypothetical protein Tco_1317372 [Tanacetum coccineum]